MAEHLSRRDSLLQTDTNNPQASPAHLTIRRAIEAAWLTAAVAIPLAIVHEDWMISSEATPKVLVLHSTAMLLISLVLLEWATAPRRAAEESNGAIVWLRRFGFVDHPARFVFMAVASVLLTNLLSLAFSPVPAVSIAGADAGTDSSGLLDVASYIVIFWVTATHLKSGAQLRRLFWAITMLAVTVSLIGVGQRFGFDPWTGPIVRNRVPMTMGNPIFAAGFVMLTVPLTAGVIMWLKDRIPPLLHMSIGVGVLGVQLLALLFTASRSASIGLTFALLAFLGASAWVLGVKSLRRPATMLAIFIGFALLLGAADPKVAGRALERISTIPTALVNLGDDGLSGRVDIWSVSSTAYWSGPWIDTEEFPEIPDIAPAALRPLVGYGPDMYKYAYLAASGPHEVEHGHNFLVHTAVELGSAGVAAYAGLAAALAAALLSMLRRARGGGMPLWHVYAVVGLTGVMAGRLVEQMGSKAQISDLTLWWILVGTVVAMTAMTPQSEPADASRARQRGRRRAQLRTHSGGEDGLLARPFHLAGAVSVSLVLAFFWWQSVLPTANSSVTTAKALELAKTGQREATIEAYERAIDQSPSVAINHMALADVLRTLSTVATTDQRLELLQQADAHIQMVLDRNPLDHRAHSMRVDIRRRMTEADPSLAPSAIDAIKTLKALTPGHDE
jgi:hypothetical protein